MHVSAQVNDVIICNNQQFKITYNEATKLIAIAEIPFCAVGDIIISYKTTLAVATTNHPKPSPITESNRYMVVNAPPSIVDDVIKGSPFYLMNIDTNEMREQPIYISDMYYTSLVTILACDRITNFGPFTDIAITGVIK